MSSAVECVPSRAARASGIVALPGWMVYAALAQQQVGAGPGAGSRVCTFSGSSALPGPPAHTQRGALAPDDSARGSSSVRSVLFKTISGETKLLWWRQPGRASGQVVRERRPPAITINNWSTFEANCLSAFRAGPIQQVAARQMASMAPPYRVELKPMVPAQVLSARQEGRRCWRPRAHRPARQDEGAIDAILPRSNLAVSVRTKCAQAVRPERRPQLLIVDRGAN